MKLFDFCKLLAVGALLLGGVPQQAFAMDAEAPETVASAAAGGRVKPTIETIFKKDPCVQTSTFGSQREPITFVDGQAALVCPLECERKRCFDGDINFTLTDNGGVKHKQTGGHGKEFSDLFYKRSLRLSRSQLSCVVSITPYKDDVAGDPVLASGGFSLLPDKCGKSLPCTSLASDLPKSGQWDVHVLVRAIFDGNRCGDLRTISVLEHTETLNPFENLSVVLKMPNLGPHENTIKGLSVSLETK